VKQRLSGLVEDADVHVSGMEVDAAVKWVLSVVKSHWGLLLVNNQVVLLSAYHGGLLGRGPQ
jgi:hypothetical protein